MASWLEELSILLAIIVSIIIIRAFIRRWLKKLINELENKVNQLENKVNTNKTTIEMDRDRGINELENKVNQLENKVNTNKTTIEMDRDCGIYVYRILNFVTPQLLKGIDSGFKNFIEKDLNFLDHMSTQLRLNSYEPVSIEKSPIRLLPLGIKIIKELRTLKAYLDEDEHLTDIAEKKINQEIEDSEGSNVRLLSKLNLMTDILISKHTINEEIKNASRILKQKNYTGNPFPVFTSAVLVYILNRCVEKRMLEENILNLVSEATEELTTFREQIGLGG